MEPKIISRNYFLVGFEDKIELNDKHWHGMDVVKSALKENLCKIKNKVEPIRFFGLWMVDPDVDYNKSENHSKRMYFFGVEVTNMNDFSPNCKTKTLPESKYAVFKEREHGTTQMYEWLKTSGYVRNDKIVPALMLDMEVLEQFYNEKDQWYDGIEWEVLIPIQEKT